MCTAIVPFQFQNNTVRTVTRADAHWFVAKDVCDILELSDTSMALQGLDEDEKGTSTIGTLGGKQKMLIVSESGLYALIFKSRKPEAKAFRKWVTSEVLPALRKTGRYAAPAAPAVPAAMPGAEPVRHFRGRLVNGRMVLEEYSPVVMLHDVALWLADPAASFPGSSGPAEDRARFLEIAKVATMRATLGPHETWRQLYGAS